VHIFGCCNQQEASMAEVIGRGGLLLTFCRSFGARESTEWREMSEILRNTILSGADDVGYWLLTKDQKYSSKSLYSNIMD
jgi:hypothetical protein